MLRPDQVLFDVLHYSPDAIAVYDTPDLRIAFANQQMCAMWNRTDALTGRLMGDVFPEFEEQGFLDILRSVWAAGNSYRATDTPADIRKDGQVQTCYFDFEYKALLDADGHTYAIIHSSTEVSARMEAWRLVQEKEEREAAINEELEAANEEVTSTLEELDKTYQQLSTVHERLLDTEEKARLITKIAPVALAVLSAENFTLDAANDLFLEIWQLNDRSIGQPLLAVLPALDAQIVAQILQSVLQSGDTAEASAIQMLTASYGNLANNYFNFIYQPIYSKTGNITDIMVVANNVTTQQHAKMDVDQALQQADLARRASEQLTQELRERDYRLQQLNEELGASNEEHVALNEELEATNENLLATEEHNLRIHEDLQKAFADLTLSEDRLSLAIQSAEFGTWTLDLTDNTVYLDARTQELYGHPAADLIPYEEVLQYMHADDRPTVHQAVLRAVTTGSDGQYDIQFRTVGATDGKLRWLHCKGRAYFDELDQPLLFSGIARDITDTVMTKQRMDEYNRIIAEKKSILQLIVDSAQVGTFTFDLKTEEIQLNGHARALFGFLPDEPLTANSPIEQTLPAFVPVAQQAMQDALSSGSPCDYSYQIQHKQSGKIKWLRSVGSAASGADGAVDMFYGVILDVTDQKMEEQRKLDFLGIASHELRSPLTSLSAYLQILAHKRGQMDAVRVQDMLENASRQAGRMRELIEGFLDVARMDEGKVKLKRTTVDLPALLSDLEKTVVETFDTHSVVFEQQGAVPPLSADRDKLEQVLINLLNNAIKYSPAQTTVRILLDTHEGHARLQVIDQGPGISPADQSKIFDRFYRVENQQNDIVNGFGIGLFISREIVRLHGGKIGLQSTPGSGTTFWFSIPLAVLG